MGKTKLSMDDIFWRGFTQSQLGQDMVETRFVKYRIGYQEEEKILVSRGRSKAGRQLVGKPNLYY